MASNLMKQFLDTGFVEQDDDGTFSIPAANSAKKFKPFED